MKKQWNFNGFPLRILPKTGTIEVGKPDEETINRLCSIPSKK
jgi:hypothetical protein